MGLKWSAPKSVKNDTLLVVNAALPENKAQKDELFNLWKFKKEGLKADGFQLGKNKFKDYRWEITYFHTITDTSREKTKAGVSVWKADFDRKCKKWQDVMDRVREAVNSKSADDLDEETVEKVDIADLSKKLEATSLSKDEVDDVNDAMEQMTISKPAPPAPKAKLPSKAPAKAKPKAKPPTPPPSDDENFSEPEDE